MGDAELREALRGQIVRPDTPDGPCWCWPLNTPWHADWVHSPLCVKARVALAAPPEEAVDWERLERAIWPPLRALVRSGNVTQADVPGLIRDLMVGYARLAYMDARHRGYWCRTGNGKRYWPDYQAMGDCKNCGHVYDDHVGVPEPEEVPNG